MTEKRIRKTVTVSPKNHISKQELRRWVQNLLKFTAPYLAIFFGQLAMGVEVKVALPVALVAFYAALADFFTKYKDETILP